MDAKRHSAPIRVLIGSAGRRVYLIRWFREAFKRLGIDGEILVTENDPTSSSVAAADGAYVVPRYDDPRYSEVMIEIFVELKPKLFFSVNDYELSALAGGLADKLRGLGTTVLSFGDREQRIVEDKFALARQLRNRGITTPKTALGSAVDDVRQLAESADELVVKHRFGSGSSGLLVVSPSQISHAVEISSHTAPRVGLDSPRDAVVVQPRLLGAEYGVDVVAPLAGPGVGGCEVLARRKMRMRSGETDKAATVSAKPFRELAIALGEMFQPRGLIDIDVIMGMDGRPAVIDVNPRFGGGYVFSHLAGADAPHYYLAQCLGLQPSPDWAQYETDVVAAKYEDAVVTSSAESPRGRHL